MAFASETRPVTLESCLVDKRVILDKRVLVESASPKFPPNQIIGTGKVIMTDHAGYLWVINADGGTMSRVKEV